jgi:hypothetical protein
MKLGSRPLIFVFLPAALVYGACGGGSNTSTSAGTGAATAMGGNGGAAGQGGAGEGGLFPSGSGGIPNGGAGGSGGGGSGGATTTSMTGGPCQSPNPSTATTLFAKKAGGDDVQTALGVATDAQGNVFLAGGFAGALDFGAGQLSAGAKTQAFVAKLDKNGVAAWSKGYGDASYNHYAQHVATDAQGDVIVTGHFRGSIDFGGGALNDVYNFFEDLFVAKLSPAGAHVWSHRYGDTNSEESQGIATDAQGNVIVVGAFQKGIDFGGGKLVAEESGFNAFVAKLSAAGDQQWAKSLGDATAEQKALGVAADKDGNVYVSGYFQGSIDLGDGAKTADMGTQSAWVAKYNAAGSLVWGKTWASSNAVSAVAIAADSAGDVYVLGNLKGKASFGGDSFDAGVADDVFVVKLDKSGNHVWSRTFGTPNSAEEATALALDGDSPVVTGIFTSKINFGGGDLVSGGGFDIFLAKLDKDGCQIHANAYGGPMLQRAESVAVDPTSNIFLAGGFDGSTDFGTGMLTASATDVFVMKTKP